MAAANTTQKRNTPAEHCRASLDPVPASVTHGAGVMSRAAASRRFTVYISGTDALVVATSPDGPRRPNVDGPLDTGEGVAVLDREQLGGRSGGDTVDYNG